MSLPYEGTTVPEVKSIMGIQTMLQDAGFEDTAIVTRKDRKAVIAMLGGAEFRFEINPETIVDKIISEYQDSWKAPDRDKIMPKAARMGWRALFYQVKSSCDSIRLGAIEPIHAFGGMLQIRDDAGKPVSLANELLIKIEAGEFKGQTIAGLLPDLTADQEAS